MRRATAYQRSNAILIHPSSRTTDHVWILTEPCVALPTDCPDAELGHAVQSALARSEADVPHPMQWSGLLDPLLHAAGVKSWKTFTKGALCVEIEQAGDALTFAPTKNHGAAEGFEAIPAQSIVTALQGDEAIGATLRAAFRAAE